MIRSDEQEGQQNYVQNEYTNHLADELTDELTYDLLNVDFSCIEVPTAEKHPKWESLFQFAQLKIAEELGSENEIVQRYFRFLSVCIKVIEL